jgi:hypothetical protein
MIEQAQIDAFFATARERYAIMERRRSGAPGPWTTDKIFGAYRFCNTFREDDRTTIWFRDNLRAPLADRPVSLLFATVAFRWFNRISTGEIIKADLLAGPSKWEPDAIRAKLKDVKPVVTGAYIIKTPDGKTKLDGILWCLENIRKDVHHLADAFDFTAPDERLAEGTWEVLMSYPYLGSFMAYQIISDLLHTPLLDKAQDKYTWAAMGPGSTRGCGWLYANNPDEFSMNGKADRVMMKALMQVLVSKSEQAWGRKWTMQEVQHWLCEHDKYTRATGGQAQKRKFP